MGSHRYKLVATFAILTLGALLAPAKLQAQTLQIDSATANWIEGFADFTRWPEKQTGERLTAGIINAPEIATYLRRRAAQRLSEPSIEVVEISPEDSFENLDIVFVGPDTRSHWDQIFLKTNEKGILCIGAQEGFNDSGGTVELVVRKNRLRFLINIENARKSGISLSSKLLELAVEPR